LPQVLTDKTGSYFCEVFVEVLSKVPMGKLIKEVIIPHWQSRRTFPQQSCGSSGHLECQKYRTGRISCLYISLMASL